MILFIVIIVVTSLFMECVAWFLHKYVMHGFGWCLHSDHHKRENHDSFFELNDSFFVFFAALSIIAFSIWSATSSSVALGIGIGISIYGAAYFFVHDLFIHQRIKVLTQTKNKYLLAIRRAHKMHHKHLGKHEGECFGMLWVPLKYFKTKH
jgi:beta-carotene 3-hydroxylase